MMTRTYQNEWNPDASLYVGLEMQILGCFAASSWPLSGWDVELSTELDKMILYCNCFVLTCVLLQAGDLRLENNVLQIVSSHVSSFVLGPDK